MPGEPASLSLWKKGLRQVPEWVWDRTDLEVLILAGNELFEVSERVGNLKRLRTLDLGHNRLTQAPDSLGDLDGLADFLYLHDNQLASLPCSLGRLKKLRYL
jgi:Leucine-rich repeat (LRR) protein